MLTNLIFQTWSTLLIYWHQSLNISISFLLPNAYDWSIRQIHDHDWLRVMAGIQNVPKQNFQDSIHKLNFRILPRFLFFYFSLCSWQAIMVKNRSEKTSVDIHKYLVGRQPHCEYKKIMEEFWKTVSPMNTLDFFI